MSIEIIILAAVAVVWGISILGFVAASRRHGRAIRELKEALAERDRDIAAVQGDLAALTKASLGAGDHLMQVENRVRRLSERQSQTEMRAVGDRPYQQAIQLVQTGADADELVRQCGMTRGEADLIVMLHGVAQAG